jgi:threonine synthase
MKYVSTRGNAPVLGFDDVVLAGLASDGGLYVPEKLPSFSRADIEAMAGMHYTDLAATIMRPFVGGALSEHELRDLLNASYSDFRHAAIAPLKQIDVREWVLELFHGPTLAFKDFALQFLGRLMHHILTKKGQKLVVLGATSGDTGSAAIAGCRGSEAMDIVILFPHGRVSDVQRRQMTTVADKNVHCLAIEGNFDDCQRIVKNLFVDEPFRAAHPLGAVNSINWVRILAQVVYYYYAALSLGAPSKSVAFSVPTGNFGDIYAGHLARVMGLPIADLVVASNKNDILTRCYHTGVYGMEGVFSTLSPSMDIQVSSNFERLLYDLYGKDTGAIQGLMTGLKQEGRFALGKAQHKQLQQQFSASCVDDDTTIACMQEMFMSTGEVLDPHTAVGVRAALNCRRYPELPMITLATAHPAKFPDAVQQACGVEPQLPYHMQDLFDKPERQTILPASEDAVKRYIQEKVA